MTWPFVSVCVPTFNGMPYLPLTIESVLRQTLGDFELIIVDDASTDGTADYLATLRDPRIRFERNKQNLGAAATWTRATDLATAKYVKLLCHDDLIEPMCLADQIQALDGMPAAVLCTCWRRVINASGKTLLTRRGLRAASGFASGEKVIRDIVTRGTNVIGEPSAVLFRRDAWSAVRPWDSDNLYMIDVAMWAKLLRNGGVAVIASPLCSFRISTTSLSATLARQQGRDNRRFYRALAAEYCLPRWRLWMGLIRATINAAARQLLFAQQ